MQLIESILTRISQNPHMWNILRFMVEDGFRGEKDVITRTLAPWSDYGQRYFLDLGCGTGAFAHCFPPTYYTGVDLSVEYIRFANSQHQGTFIACDSTMLALESQRFDAALVLGLLHHLPDPVAHATISELHRVLRPKATALVMEDIPPPDVWNVAGHAMHWLDRGGFIRNEADYCAFFQREFEIQHTYTMRSGICDYGVYILQRKG